MIEIFILLIFIEVSEPLPVYPSKNCVLCSILTNDKSQSSLVSSNSWQPYPSQITKPQLPYNGPHPHTHYYHSNPWPPSPPAPMYPGPSRPFNPLHPWLSDPPFPGSPWLSESPPIDPWSFPNSPSPRPDYPTNPNPYPVYPPKPQTIVVSKPIVTFPSKPSKKPVPTPAPIQDPKPKGFGCGIQAPQFQPDLESKTKIMNGKEAKPHSWPWIVNLFMAIPLNDKGDQSMSRCSGNLVRVRDDIEESDILITAAHCVVNPSSMQPGKKPEVSPLSWLRIMAGNHRFGVAEFEQNRDIEDVRLHPNFHFQPPMFNPENDVAVIKLAKSIIFEDAIRPVCLPDARAFIPTGRICVTAGWGKNDSKNDSATAEVLDQLILPVHSPSVCQSSWPGFYKEKQMICAGKLDGSAASCHGDSGGMLACKENDGRWVMYGVTSWGSRDCLTKKKLVNYARVSTYRSWIDQTIHEMTSL